MYCTRNFKSKKEFKAAVEAWVAGQASGPISDAEQAAANALGQVAFKPRPVTYYQPGPFGGNEPRDGWLTFEGPHYPQPHKWYAQALAKDGVIVRVK